MSDAVNHPPHYADKKIEVIDYIRDTLPPSGFVDYCIGNVIKYVSRWRKKGGAEDLKKARSISPGPSSRRSRKKIRSVKKNESNPAVLY